jgi:hypothetical protein
MVGLLFLIMFYAGLEASVLYSDTATCTWNPDATLCIGEGVVDSIRQATHDLDDYVRDSM